MQPSRIEVSEIKLANSGFLIFGNAIIEGRSSLHDFFGRYVMEFEKTPEIKSINYMKKVKLRGERGKSG